MKKFDNRSKEEFMNDIYFGTKLEKYFFNQWLERCRNKDFVKIYNERDNGIDNQGGFVKKGDTSRADYMIDLIYRGHIYRDLPIEVKWVPTHGKFSLKMDDLYGYIRQSASILFIYNGTKTKDLRKPKDYDFDRHVKNIESVSNQFKWCIMTSSDIEKIIEHYKSNELIKPIPYMGNKRGIVIDQNYLSNWVKEEIW